MQPKKSIVGFDFEEPTRRPLNIILHHVAVEADVRPIRVTWTPELAQDLNAFQNIDAEQELTNLLAEEVGRQIDMEIVEGLIRAGGHRVEDSDPLKPSRNYRHHYLVEPERRVEWDMGLWGHAHAESPIIQFPEVRQVQNHLVGLDIQPMGPPQGRLFYFEPQYTAVADPVVLDSGAWYMDDTFESDFVKSRVMRYNFKIPKVHNIINIARAGDNNFDSVELPVVNRRFT
jgi:hypothetical protein